MHVLYTRLFLKQVGGIVDKKVAAEVAEAIRDVKKAVVPGDIKTLKKLKGATNAYRIKLGTYRIGLYLNSDVVEFACFMGRKDIYKRFP